VFSAKEIGGTLPHPPKKKEKKPPHYYLFPFVLCMFVVLQFLDQWSKSLLNLERFSSLEESDATKPHNKDKGSRILQPGLCFWQKRTKKKKKERKKEKKNPHRPLCC